MSPSLSGQPLPIALFKPRPVPVSAVRFSGGGIGGRGSEPAPISANKFETETTKALDKRGLPRRQRAAKLKRGLLNFWLILSGTAFGSVTAYSVTQAIKGPDLSHHSPSMVSRYQELNVPQGLSKEKVEAFLNNAFTITESSETFQKLSSEQKEALRQETRLVTQELAEIHQIQSSHEGTHGFLGILTGLIAIITLAFGTLRQTSKIQSEVDDTYLLMKNIALSPKRFLDGFRKNQYEMVPLSAEDTKAMAAGLVRISQLAHTMMQHLENRIETYADIREHLIAGLGKIPSNDEFLALSLQKAMDSLLDSGVVGNKPWTQTRQINQLTLLTHLETLMQDGAQTGYLLESFIPEDTPEIQKLRTQEILTTAEEKTLHQFDEARAHIRLANAKSGFYQAESMATQAQKWSDTLEAKMMELATQNTPEANQTLLDLHQQKERNDLQCQSYRIQLDLAQQLQRQAQHDLLKLSQREHRQSAAALQRMLERQKRGADKDGMPVSIDDTIERLAYENEVASLTGRVEGPDTPENELGRIKADLILRTQQKNHKSSSYKS